MVPHRLGFLFCTLVFTLWMVGASALANAEPVSAEEKATSEDNRLRQRMEAAPLELKEIPIDPRFHRGGTYTDSGEGQPNVLTQSELELLEMARAAIEASRAAGTLHITRLPADIGLASDEDQAAMKMQHYEARRAQGLTRRVDEANAEIATQREEGGAPEKTTDE